MEYEKVQYIKKKYYPVKHFTIITIAGKQKIKFLYCISKIKNNIYIYIYIYVYYSENQISPIYYFCTSIFRLLNMGEK